MGLGRFELPTPRLSSVCSNQLSYRPLSQTKFEIPYLLPKVSKSSVTDSPGNPGSFKTR